MENENAIDQELLDELDQIKVCPRINGYLGPCFMARCKHHTIYRILSEREFNQRSTDEIAEMILMLKETCMIDVHNTFVFELEGAPPYDRNEIAFEMGISSERVRVMLGQAFRKLRNLPTMRRLHQDHVSSNSHDPFKLRKKQR